MQLIDADGVQCTQIREALILLDEISSDVASNPHTKDTLLNAGSNADIRLMDVILVKKCSR
jgi:hypothetical protein